MYEPTRVNTVWSVGLRACVYEPTRVNTVWSVGLRATLQYILIQILRESKEKIDLKMLFLQTVSAAAVKILLYFIFHSRDTFNLNEMFSIHISHKA